MLLLHLDVVDTLIPEVAEPREGVIACTETVCEVVVGVVMVLRVVTHLQQLHGDRRTVAVRNTLHRHTISADSLDVAAWHIRLAVLVACLVVLVGDVLWVGLQVAHGVL